MATQMLNWNVIAGTSHVFHKATILSGSNIAMQQTCIVTFVSGKTKGPKKCLHGKHWGTLKEFDVTLSPFVEMRYYLNLVFAVVVQIIQTH